MVTKEVDSMKYIIMCGGKYEMWETPRHLSKICGEEIVARTIRLLKENGIEDISISSDNSIFEKFGLPILKHNNSYITHDFGNVEGDWFDAFYPTNKPTCYIFGDVVFSPEAIKTIIETKTDDIEFFGSKPPFANNYFKDHEEPFALKVVNTTHLKEAIQKTRELDKQGKFWRKPLMWELWTVIKNVPLQTKPDNYTADYTVINDYTVDIDRKSDVMKLEYILGGGDRMVKIECTVAYNDVKLGRLVEIGETLVVTKERADYLVNERQLAKVIEVIPDEVKEEVKPIEEVKETPKAKPRRTKKK